MSDQITVEFSSKSFSVNELPKALALATNTSRKKKNQVVVTLPACEIPISTVIQTKQLLKLRGQEGTVLVFEENGVINVLKSLSLENLECRRGDGRSVPTFVVSGQFISNNVTFQDCKISSEAKGTIDLQASRIVKSPESKLDDTPSGLLFYSNGAHILSQCEIYGYPSGILCSCLDNEGNLDLSESSISCETEGILVEGCTATIDQVTFNQKTGVSLRARGVKAKVTVTNCEFEGFTQALVCQQEAEVTYNACNFEGSENSIACLALDHGATVKATKCSIKNIKKYAITLDLACELNMTEVKFDNIENGIKLVNESKIEADNLTIENVKGTALNLESRSTGVIKETKVVNCKIGATVENSALLQLEKFTCQKFETGVRATNAGLQIRGGKVQNTGKGVGIEVVFTKEGKFKVLLRDFAAIKCETGGIFRDGEGDDKKMASKSELQNCSFVQCNVGCDVDRAAVDLFGSSFVVNSKHSIIIKNQKLRNVGQLRKEARLRIRWVNLIERRFEDGEQVSNDSQMFADCSEEREFRVLQDFESVLYRPILSERLRQSMNFFRSRDMYSMNLARIIMKSVSHCLKLVKDLKKDFLQSDLIESPELGMFAATFKLNPDEKTNKTNNLILMDDLLESWQSLRRVGHFDEALRALDEAFNRKQIDDDVFDEWIAPLEEMQRDCFVDSKYNRRRDYLLENVKKDPLSAWYFLAKESKTTTEGKKLRKEVLHYLAAAKDTGPLNYNASWVGQWAVHEMGRSFRMEAIPDDFNLRRAWADNLLDHGNAKELLVWYNAKGYEVHQMDQLMQFEAYKQIEAVRRLNGKEIKKSQSLLNGGGSSTASQAAARMFSGTGALPGFIRRTVEKAKDIEEVLVFLRPVYEDHGNDKWKKERVCMSALAHFFMRDPTTQPKLLGQKEVGYETCPMCFIQKLQPWNELKLDECEHGHVFCRGCLKQSMSTGSRELWGRCPGTTDEGEECTAYANRREMEMSGMEVRKVFNILSVRVQKKLSDLPDWRDCPHCKIGGKANVKKSYFMCKLCDQLVTEDGGESDPTVKIKLLEGLDGSKAARGAGVFRECFYCASPYEKGNACSTITCSNCGKQFSMTWGSKNLNHRFEDSGVGPQRYVPQKAGNLWKLEVFKDRKGNRLKMGQQLSDGQVKEVLRRARMALSKLRV